MGLETASILVKAKRFGQRNFISIFIPTFVFGSIYYDQKRTWDEKNRKAAESRPEPGWKFKEI